MTNQDSKYNLFPEDGTKYNLVEPTNNAIRNVLEVPAFSAHLEGDERVHYAMQGEVVPVLRDDNGNLKVELKDVYDYDTYWANLTDRLFVEDLKLFDENGEINKERYDALNRSEARRGFDDFLGKFAVQPYEVKNLFKRLSANQNIPQMTAMVVQQVVAQLRELGNSK